MQWLVSLYLVSKACDQWKIGGGGYVKDADHNFLPMFYWAISTLNKTSALFFLLSPYFLIYILTKKIRLKRGKSPRGRGQTWVWKLGGSFAWFRFQIWGIEATAMLRQNVISSEQTINVLTPAANAQHTLRPYSVQQQQVNEHGKRKKKLKTNAQTKSQQSMKQRVCKLIHSGLVAVSSSRASASIKYGEWQPNAFPIHLLKLSLIHIWRCRRIERCRSRWSPYH